MVPSHIRLIARLIAVGLVALFTACLVGCAAPRTASQPSERRLVTYRSAAYGFSIAHPAGWREVMNPGFLLATHPGLSFSVAWVKPASGGEQQRQMFVAVVRREDPVPAARISSSRRAVLRQFRHLVGHAYPRSPDMWVTAARAVRLAGKPAALMRSVYTNTKVDFDQYFVIAHTGVIYLIGLSGPPGDFAKTFRGLPATLRVVQRPDCPWPTMGDH
jgi:hypothetical protein